MTDEQIMGFIELTSENTGLKVQQKITEAIAAHEKGCANQFNGRLEMVENAAVGLARKNDSRFDQLGPIVGSLFKNWKVLAVVFVLLTTTLGSIKQGKTYTVDDLKQIIKQVQETELDGKAVETEPVEKEKQIY